MTLPAPPHCWTNAVLHPAHTLAGRAGLLRLQVKHPLGPVKGFLEANFHLVLQVLPLTRRPAAARPCARATAKYP